MSDKRPTLLLVDDDPMTRRTVRRVLGRDFNMLDAGSVRAAWTLLERGGVDIVVSDLHLGADDGAVFLASVEERYPTIPRIVLTADTSTRAFIGAVDQANARRVLYKPWNSAQLLGVLRQCCGMSRRRRRVGPRSPSSYAWFER